MGALILLFFEGQGTERLIDRIEYGLEHSKDDLRVQLYKDTLPMIADHPLLGVGVGMWGKSYPQYMHISVSGINPVYLHSEPLQLVAEAGVPAAFIVITGLFLFLIRGGRTIRRIDTMVSKAAACLLAGLTGQIVASSFDFTYHIPAIAFLSVILGSLTAFLLDQLGKEQ